MIHYLLRDAFAFREKKQNKVKLFFILFALYKIKKGGEALPKNKKKTSEKSNFDDKCSLYFFGEKGKGRGEW